MEAPRAEIHQVGTQMINRVCEKIDGSEEYLGPIEGGGICLANSFPTPEQVDQWLQSMLRRIYAGHHCGLGCISLPGSKFLADADELERLAALEHARPSQTKPVFAFANSDRRTRK